MNNEVISQQELPQEQKNQFRKSDVIILITSFIFALLFNRLIIVTILSNDFNLVFFSAVFMFLILLFFSYVYREKILKNHVALCASICIGSLCVWNFIFDYNSVFGYLSFLVIPLSGMMLLQLVCGGFGVKDCGKMLIAWFSGFIIKPLSAIPMFFKVIDYTVLNQRNNNLKKLIIGLEISGVMLIIIVPLLAGADMVFGYYINKMFGEFNLFILAFHVITILVAFMLFYSFMWNTYNFKQDGVQAESSANIDAFIATVVLIVLLITYSLFCVIQFSYLFAGAGLPGELTYSEYARQGFSQLVIVSAINLMLYGAVTSFCRNSKLLLCLRAALLTATAVILLSGFIRLKLYIDSFGLTWLRLLSAWFIAYLAVVIILCIIRLFNETIPLIIICSCILLVWYCVLGYSNPEKLIVNYNTQSTNVSQWVEENERMLNFELSNDAIVALINKGISKEQLLRFVNFQNGYSASYHKMANFFPPMDAKLME